MSTAVAIPEPSAALDVQALADDVGAIIAAIELIDDLDVMLEIQARAAALEEYLVRRGLDPVPGWAIARHADARIGALLGAPRPEPGRPPKGQEMSARGHFPRQRHGEFWMLDRYRSVWELSPGPRRQCLTAIERHRRKVIDVDARAIDDVTDDDAEGERWQMLAGSLDDRGCDIKDKSIDLIVTDPPYPTEMLPLWYDLGELSARVLKPQAILVALSGKIILPDVIDQLRRHLTYGWVYCQPLPGSSSRILARHVGQSWKPWLAFSNGPWPSGRVDWHPDMLDGVPLSKDRYRWEQSTGPARQLIRYLAPENGLVLDPFAGTGSYGTAALQAERRFIGIEADHDRYQTCCDRLAET